MKKEEIDEGLKNHPKMKRRRRIRVRDKRGRSEGRADEAQKVRKAGRHPSRLKMRCGGRERVLRACTGYPGISQCTD